MMAVGADGSTSSEYRIFSIDKNTGDISVDPKYIDREEIASHTLCVNASTSAIDSSENADQAKVIVRVTDNSDHRVEFIQNTVSTGNSKPH